MSIQEFYKKFVSATESNVLVESLRRLSLFDDPKSMFEEKPNNEPAYRYDADTGGCVAGIGCCTGQAEVRDPVAMMAAIWVTQGRVLMQIVPRLSHPPGWSLRRFAELCFSKKTFSEILEPSLSNMQGEHFDALAAGRLWKARMVLVRGYWSFWSAVIAQLPISLARRVYEVWKATKAGS